MIEEVFDLRQTMARDVMEPLESVAALPIGSPVEEAVERIVHTTQPGLLVFRDRPSHIVGAIFPAQLLDVPPETPIDDLVEQIVRVPEHEPLDSLLEQLQRSQHHLAIVSDPRGVSLGLVTLEDVLEEIVGEIEEEA